MSLDQFALPFSQCLAFRFFQSTLESYHVMLGACLTSTVLSLTFSPNSLLWGLLFKKKRCAQACARLLSWAWLGRGVGVAWACVAWAWRGRGLGVAWAWLGRGVGVAWARLGRGVAWAWRGRGVGVAWAGRGLGVAWAWLGRGVGVAWAWRGPRTWSCYCEDLWGVFQVPWPTCYGVNDTDYHHQQQQKQ